MLSALFATTSESVVQIAYWSKTASGVPLVAGSATGFLIGQYLVSVNHGQRQHSSLQATLRRHTDPGDLSRCLSMPAPELQARLVAGSVEEQWDYAIYDVKGLLPANDTLGLQEPADLSPGHPVACQGFPLQKPNLTSHSGMISSRYRRNGVDVLQLDMMINGGNSGGPLLDVTTGKVIGIVARKETGFTPGIQAYKRVLRQRAAAHDLAIGESLGLTDPEHWHFGQSESAELSLLVMELERSANVGIAYAFSSEGLLREPVLRPHI